MLKFITTIQAWCTTRRDDDRGATMVEYGLMVALIAVVAMAGAQILGQNILGVFNRIATAIGA